MNTRETNSLIQWIAVFSSGHSLAGFPQEDLRWRIKSQEDEPIRAQGHARSQVISSFNSQQTPQHFAWSNE